MESKLFYILLATIISCARVKDPIKSTNNSKATDASKKRADELKRLKEIAKEIEKETQRKKELEKEKKILEEQIAQEEANKKLKKETEEELKRLEEIARKDREKANREAEEIKKQEEKKFKKAQERKEDLEALFNKKIEEIKKLEAEEKERKQLNKKNINKKINEESTTRENNKGLEDLKIKIDEEKSNLKEELEQKSFHSLTSNEIDAKIDKAKQAALEIENPFKKVLEKRESLSSSQIEEKINAHKKQMENKSSLAEDLKVNSMLETVNNSSIQEQKEDLTESAIERENREWGLGSSILNSSYENDEIAHSQINNNILTMPLNGQTFSELFKPTAQGSYLSNSALGKIKGVRKHFSDSQVDDEDLEDSENGSN